MPEDENDGLKDPDFHQGVDPMSDIEVWETAQLLRWQERYNALAESMHGFGMLVWMAQGILVGASLASEEIWVTENFEQTRFLVQTHWNMMKDWGFER